MSHVSVIILAYNQQDFIEKAINGVFMQKTDFPIELIISNDCSPDKMHETIEKVIAEKPNHVTVKYFNHNKNLGATPNFYFALKQVSGKYLAFCEGDDYWTDDNKLQMQSNFMESHPDYAMCFHNVLNVSPNSEINNTLFSNVEDRDYSVLDIYNHWLVHTTSVFMKTETLLTEAVKKTLVKEDLLYFDTVLYMANSLVGKIRGMTPCMSAYRRHEVGLSHGVNHKRDLRHNELDEVIGSYYGGKIKESSNWQIFNRSRIAFNNSLKNNEWNLAIKHLQWMIRKKGNLRIYWMKKIQK